MNNDQLTSLFSSFDSDLEVNEDSFECSHSIHSIQKTKGLQRTVENGDCLETEFAKDFIPVEIKTCTDLFCKWIRDTQTELPVFKFCIDFIDNVVEELRFANWVSGERPLKIDLDAIVRQAAKEGGKSVIGFVGVGKRSNWMLVVHNKPFDLIRLDFHGPSAMTNELVQYFKGQE
jgi:hypothetical protein